MFSVLLSIALSQWGQCPGGRCGGPPQMMFPTFAPPTYIQPPSPIVQQPFVQPAPAFSADDDIYPTYHYPPGTVMVWSNGQLVPNQEPTEVSYPGQPKQRYVTGKSYPAVKAAALLNKPASKTKDGAQGHGCPDGCTCEDCKCGDNCQCGKATAVKSLEFTQEADDAIPNYGIDNRKMKERQGRLRYSTNGGQEISKDTCNRLMGADGLPDDSTHMFLTTIGTEAEQQQVRDAVKENPAVFEKVRCKFYAPTDDMIKDKGFAGAVTLTDAKGKVAYRFPTMPEKAQLVGEVNKRRPDYDPNKDPQPNKPDPNPIPSPLNIDLNKVPVWVWVVAAFVGWTYLNKQQPAPVKA